MTSQVLFLGLSALAGMVVSCGEEARTADSPPALDLDTCSENWRTVYSPEQAPFSFTPTVLRWDRGHLYTVVQYRLISVPDVGGQGLTLQDSVWSRPLWIENGNVLFFAAGEQVNLPTGGVSAPLLLKSVPEAGGSSRALATVREAGRGGTFDTAWALDAEHIYWVDGADTRSPSVWAGPRAGGEPRNLATLDSSGDVVLFDDISPVGDDLLVYPTGLGFDVPVFSVPRTGGAARRLPTAWQSARLVAVANDGTVLVQRTKTAGSGEPGSERFETGVLRPGADAVEPFWPNAEPTAYAIRGWDDGNGGFFVHAWEWGPNDSIHATMWQVDAAGRGQRLGCDPLVKGMISAATVAPDGIYGILRPGNTFEYWSIVKIGR